MDDYILTCLKDIRNAILEVESYFIDYPFRYDIFEKDMKTRRAVERNVEIMGEAMNRIRKVEPDYQIPNAKEVIATRNRVIHSYEYVEPTFLWGLVVRHIPELKKDIELLISERLQNGNFDSEVQELLK
ncbi:MAG: DUF86 domain-containing protein [Muribaculaceae bacterium]|nr:DUF86 domain-containing protein [Muribaculaceae bacterium]